MLKILTSVVLPFLINCRVLAFLHLLPFKMSDLENKK